MLGDLQCFICEGAIDSRFTPVNMDGKPICSGCNSDMVRERERNRILMEQVGWANHLSEEAARLREAIRTGSIDEVEVHLNEIDHLNTVLQHSILVGKR